MASPVSNVEGEHSRVGLDRRPGAPARRGSTGTAILAASDQMQLDPALPHTLNRGAAPDNAVLAGAFQELLAADYAHRKQKDRVQALEQDLNARNNELETIRHFPPNAYFTHLQQNAARAQQQLMSAKNDALARQKKRDYTLQLVSGRILSSAWVQNQLKLPDHSTEIEKTRRLEEASSAQQRAIEELQKQVQILRQEPPLTEIARGVESLKEEISKVSQLRSMEVTAQQQTIEELQEHVHTLREGPTSIELAESAKTFKEEVQIFEQSRSTETKALKQSIEELQGKVEILRGETTSIELAEGAKVLKEQIKTIDQRQSATAKAHEGLIEKLVDSTEALRGDIRTIKQLRLSEVEASIKIKKDLVVLGGQVQVLKESSSNQSTARYLKPTDLNVYVESFEEYKKVTHDRMVILEDQAAAKATPDVQDHAGAQAQLEALSRAVERADAAYQKIQSQAAEHLKQVETRLEAVRNAHSQPRQADGASADRMTLQQISRLEQRVSEQANFLKTVSDAGTRNNHSIMAMNSRYNNLTTESMSTDMMKQVNPFIATIQSRIASINATVGQLQNITNDLQNNHKAFSLDLSGLKTGLSNTDTRVSNIEQQARDHEAFFKTVQETYQQSSPQKQLDQLSTELSELQQSTSTIQSITDRLQRKMQPLPSTINSNQEVCLENNTKLINDVKMARMEIDTRLTALEAAAARGQPSHTSPLTNATIAPSDAPAGELSDSHSSSKSGSNSPVISRRVRPSVVQRRAAAHHSSESDEPDEADASPANHSSLQLPSRTRDGNPYYLGSDIDEDDASDEVDKPAISPLRPASSKRSKAGTVRKSESYETIAGDLSPPRRASNRPLRLGYADRSESDELDGGNQNARRTIAVRERRARGSRAPPDPRGLVTVDLTEDDDISVSEDQLLEMFRGPVPPKKDVKRKQAKHKASATKAVDRHDKGKATELKRKREDVDSSPSMNSKKPTGRRK